VYFYRSVHHYYGGGNICDVTGEHRIVEVKMTLVNYYFVIYSRICFLNLQQLILE